MTSRGISSIESDSTQISAAITAERFAITYRGIKGTSTADNYRLELFDFKARAIVL